MSQSYNPPQIKPSHTEEYFHVLKLNQRSIIFGGDTLYKYTIFDTPEEKVFQTANATLLPDYSRYYSAVIGVSLYTENSSSLLRTLQGIFDNKASPSPFTRLLTKSLVIIISDGYEKLDGTTKTLLESLKLYNEAKIKTYLSSNPTQSQEDLGFMFEGQLNCIDPAKITGISSETNRESSKSARNIDVIFMTKSQNRKKLNSHLWLYKAFCPQFNPKYVVVRDI